MWRMEHRRNNISNSSSRDDGSNSSGGMVPMRTCEQSSLSRMDDSLNKKVESRRSKTVRDRALGYRRAMSRL